MKNKSRLPQNQSNISQESHTEVIYQGPIPPPAIMEKMEKLLLGAADRIFTMAEKNQDAEIAAQKNVRLQEFQSEKNVHIEKMTALWMAFIVCMGFVAGGLFLILNGYEGIGSTLIGTTMLGIVGSFLKFQIKR